MGSGREAFACAAPMYSISTWERGERRRLTAIAAVVLALHVVAGISFLRRDLDVDRLAVPRRAPLLIHLVTVPATGAAPVKAIEPVAKRTEADRSVRRHEPPVKRAQGGARTDTDTVRPAAPKQTESPRQTHSASTPITPSTAQPELPSASTAAATQERGQAPSAPEPPTRAADAAPLFDAAYLHNRAPDYPPTALARRWEGTVLLNVHVLANGTAREVTVLASSGHESLDAAALEAVADWRFVPAHQAGQAIDAWVHVPVVFKTA
ncbi:hypothetical protein C0Z18_28935 [Trinickia dabaoshanensis]|uniref:TonB C-terminal domain-containing protein n=1 Tax=Trinickia dabaoshanensis TaxID=564714 RepID=A0A2N7VD18_9BURK|nr:hypothetical protein C0Z18_28935 [Trinickia dabaoshanensis]